MATRRQAMDTLVSTIVAALTPPPAGATLWTGGAGGAPVLDGWPLPQVLEDALYNGKVAVSVTTPAADRPAPKEYLDDWVVTQAPTAGVTLTVNNVAIPPNPGTGTLTIAGSPNVGDAVILIASPGTGPKTIYGASYVVQPNDTLTTIASGLVSAINAQTGLNGLVSAASSGAVVTLTNKTNAAVSITARVGVTGQIAREIERQCATCHITIFSPDDTQRDSVGEAIKVALSARPFDYPAQITLPDGSNALLRFLSDAWIDRTLQTPLMRVLVYELDWPTLETLAAYDVEIPELTITALTEADSF